MFIARSEIAGFGERSGKAELFHTFHKFFHRLFSHLYAMDVFIIVYIIIFDRNRPVSHFFNFFVLYKGIFFAVKLPLDTVFFASGDPRTKKMIFFILKYLHFLGEHAILYGHYKNHNKKYQNEGAKRTLHK